VLEKRQPLQQMVLGKLGSTCRRPKLEPNLSPCTSINSKWIKDLHVRFKAMKLIQEKIGNTVDHKGTDNNFTNGTPIAEQLRESIDKWDCMKLKSFFTAKETVIRLKRQSTEWEKKPLPTIYLIRD
jgi:hypothetical protein